MSKNGDHVQIEMYDSAILARDGQVACAIQVQSFTGDKWLTINESDFFILSNVILLIEAAGEI